MQEPPEDPPQDNSWFTGFIVYPMILLCVSPICGAVNKKLTFFELCSHSLIVSEKRLSKE